MDQNKVAINTYNKIAKIYTKKYFEDFSDIKYIDRFLTYLSKKSKILDVGCGPGMSTKYLLNKDYIAEGIDLSLEMLRIAKEKNPEAMFTLMDMRKLNYKPDSFDGLLVSYSLIHIPSKDIPSTLKGFNKILKPNGYILIIVQKGRKDSIVNEPFNPDEKMFVNFFTIKRLTNYLEDAGFKIVFNKVVPIEDNDALSDTVIYIIAKK